MTFDYLRKGAKVIADMSRVIPGSQWFLVEYRGKRYWLHVSSKTILESHSQTKGGEADQRESQQKTN